MNKIKFEIHPSVLVVILMMLGIIFFYSYKEEPEIIEVRMEQPIPVEKTWDDVYAMYEAFPSADNGVPFVIDGQWWYFDPKIKEFQLYEQ